MVIAKAPTLEPQPFMEEFTVRAPADLGLSRPKKKLQRLLTQEARAFAFEQLKERTMPDRDRRMVCNPASFPPAQTRRCDQTATLLLRVSFSGCRNYYACRLKRLCALMSTMTLTTTSLTRRMHAADALIKSVTAT